MICPRCGYEMQRLGYHIASGGGVFWECYNCGYTKY